MQIHLQKSVFLDKGVVQSYVLDTSPLPSLRGPRYPPPSLLTPSPLPPHMRGYESTVNTRLYEPRLSEFSIIRITKFAAHLARGLRNYYYVHMRNASSVAAACSFLLPHVLFCSSTMAECVATTSTSASKPKRKRTVL